jgi:hypothetical protein
MATMMALVAPDAMAQVAKRAVGERNSNTVQASALATRITTNPTIVKGFYSAFGGTFWIEWLSRSDGSHTAETRVLLNGGTTPVCAGFTTAATFTGGGACGGTYMPAGSTITVVTTGTVAGQTIGICCVRLRYDLVDMSTPAVTLAN